MINHDLAQDRITLRARKALRVMYDILIQRGHPSGWPKLPAGPPKYRKVIVFHIHMLHESENVAHVKCLILRCANHFLMELVNIWQPVNDLIDS